MRKYLFETESGIENFKIGKYTELMKGDRLLVSNSNLTIRKKISDYINIQETEELEYIGTFINKVHKAKGPCKLFKVLNSNDSIYVKPYSRGFYVGYIIENDIDKYITNREKLGDIFIIDEKAFFNN